MEPLLTLNLAINTNILHYIFLS